VTPAPTDDDEVIGPSGASGARATVPATDVPAPPATDPSDPTSTVPANTIAVAPENIEDVDTGVNILLMGVDARDGEAIDIGVRPDSLGILNLNEDTGTCRILAVPRDSRVEIPGYGQSKVNHALAVGGIPFEMLVLESYLGISIDHYALVDFAGLVAVVDAFGGVTVDNPEAFEMGGQEFAAGEITLNGEQALLYSRYRGGSDGDFGRVEKQQQVLRALLDEANDRNVVNLVPGMWELLHDHFRTDYGMLDLLETANDFRGVCTSATLETESIPGDVQTLPDDMMDMELSFVVSEPGDVQAGVAWLLTGDATATTDGAGIATPAASPVSTPSQPDDGSARLAWRQDQGW
jgi:LCP family protein required for cell wall assembly